MKTKRWRRAALGTVLAWGCLFAGPCGITTLQFQDFASSTIIRTTVTTFASVLEAAIIAGETEQDGD